MSETPKFFRPETSKKITQKNEKKKNEKRKTNDKTERVTSTRSIRFKKRGVQEVLTYLFWILLVSMFFVVGITYSRYGLLLQQVNQKSIHSEEIIAQLNKSTGLEDKARYESEVFIKQLFTYDKENTEERQDYINSKLATGLTDNLLVSSLNKKEQTVTSIAFVGSKIISKEKEQYAFTYDINVQSEDKEENIQLSLPISIQSGDFKVMNYPTYINVAHSDNGDKNEISYQEKELLTKGEKIESDEKKALENFTKDFFNLYVTNDDSLKLISNVKGLNNAVLKSVLIKNTVKKDHYYVVEGTFSASFGELNDITSFFSLNINKTNDTYFVTQLN